MPDEAALREIRETFEKAVELEKCRKCECFKGAAGAIHAALGAIDLKSAGELRLDIERWLGQMEASEYT